MYNRSGTWQRISKIGHSLRFIFADEKSKPPEFLFFVFAVSVKTLDFSYNLRHKHEKKSNADTSKCNTVTDIGL